MLDDTAKLVNEYYLPDNDLEALNRAEIIYREIINFLSVDGDCILDVGFGGGYLIKKFLNNTSAENLYGVDINGGLLDYIDFAPKENFFVADAQKKLNMFSDGYFDLVISTDVIEHVFDPVSFFNNLLTKVKIGGFLVLNIPLELNLRNRLNIFLGSNIHNPFTVGGHIRFFKPKNLIFFETSNSCVLKKEYDQWFGDPDGIRRKIGLRKKIANLLPGLFAGRVLVFIKKIR